MSRHVADIISLAKRSDRISFSLEFFPPKSDVALPILHQRIEHLSSHDPAWISITFPGVPTGPLDPECACAVDLARIVEHNMDKPALLHLSCGNAPASVTEAYLRAAAARSISNILVCRGTPHIPDVPNAPTVPDFISLIHDLFPRRFCVVVAGHPPHPINQQTPASDAAYRRGLRELVLKVAAGAEVIVTDPVYDPDAFARFVDDCARAGITAEIVPALMPIHTYSFFQRMRRAGHAFPRSMCDAIDAVSRDDAEVQRIATAHISAVAAALYSRGVRVFHIYSMNLEGTTLKLLSAMGALKAHTTPTAAPHASDTEPSSPVCPVPRPATRRPWERNARGRTGVAIRAGADAAGAAATPLDLRRPIHWANRPQVYEALFASTPAAAAAPAPLPIGGGVDRDKESAGAAGARSGPVLDVGRRGWDDFPNDRFGSTLSPAFGEGAGLWFGYAPTTTLTRCVFKGAETLADVARVFLLYLTGRLPALPWFEQALAAETVVILRDLQRCVGYGYFTINSQPAVAARASDDPDVGWGPVGGVVHQRAYIELFTNSDGLVALLRAREVVNALWALATRDPSRGAPEMIDAVAAVLRVGGPRAEAAATVAAAHPTASGSVGGGSGAAASPTSDAPPAMSPGDVSTTSIPQSSVHATPTTATPAPLPALPAAIAGGGGASALPLPTPTATTAPSPLASITDIAALMSAGPSRPRGWANRLSPGAVDILAARQRDGGIPIASTKDVTVLTWGEFPGQSVETPTVLDPAAYVLWKDEAFALWYAPHPPPTSAAAAAAANAAAPRMRGGSSVSNIVARGPAGVPAGAPPRVLETIYHQWWLVSLVHADHRHGELGCLFALVAASGMLRPLVPVADHGYPLPVSDADLPSAAAGDPCADTHDATALLMSQLTSPTATYGDQQGAGAKDARLEAVLSHLEASAPELEALPPPPLRDPLPHSLAVAFSF